MQLNRSAMSDNHTRLPNRVLLLLASLTLLAAACSPTAAPTASSTSPPTTPPDTTIAPPTSSTAPTPTTTSTVAVDPNVELITSAGPSLMRSFLTKMAHAGVDYYDEDPDFELESYEGAVRTYLDVWLDRRRALVDAVNDGTAPVELASFQSQFDSAWSYHAVLVPGEGRITALDDGSYYADAVYSVNTMLLRGTVSGLIFNVADGRLTLTDAALFDFAYDPQAPDFDDVSTAVMPNGRWISQRVLTDALAVDIVPDSPVSIGATTAVLMSDAPFASMMVTLYPENLTDTDWYLTRPFDYPPTGPIADDYNQMLETTELAASGTWSTMYPTYVPAVSPFTSPVAMFTQVLPVSVLNGVDAGLPLFVTAPLSEDLVPAATMHVVTDAPPELCKLAELPASPDQCVDPVTAADGRLGS